MEQCNLQMTANPRTELLSEINEKASLLIHNEVRYFSTNFNLLLIMLYIVQVCMFGPHCICLLTHTIIFGNHLDIHAVPISHSVSYLSLHQLRRRFRRR